MERMMEGMNGGMETTAPMPMAPSDGGGAAIRPRPKRTSGPKAARKAKPKAKGKARKTAKRPKAKARAKARKAGGSRGKKRSRRR